MASLQSLPADQRAVLQLVLGQGRSYDEIAKMLSIDRAGVRQRALAAFDALGPGTRVSSESRSLITDYLLGQLPDPVAGTVRARLARSATERAWARIVASELASLARGPLPEIPVEYEDEGEGEPEPVAAREEEPAPTAHRPPEPEPAPEQRRSRVGGALLLAAVAAIVIAVVVVLLVSGGGSKHSSSTSSTQSTNTSSGSASTSASNTTGTSGSSHVVAQINLVPPSGGGTAGIAFVIKQGTNTGIAIRAQHVPPNSNHDAYAVWLYNSPSDSKILGFVNPGVSSNGQLSTAGGLPTDAARYKQLLVTLETQGNPHAPGKIVLEGNLTGV